MKTTSWFACSFCDTILIHYFQLELPVLPWTWLRHITVPYQSKYEYKKTNNPKECKCYYYLWNKHIWGGYLVVIITIFWSRSKDCFMQKTAKRKNFYQIALNVFFAIFDCTSEIIRLLKLCVHSWPNQRNFCYSAKLKLISIDLVALTMYSLSSLCNIAILWYILERIIEE